ncbi:isoform II, partial [Lachnotalea glycerini]
MAKRLGLPNLFNYFTMIKTHSYLNANLSDEEKTYPVVLFSSGYGSFVGQNTLQMEELASNGYIVFSISHPYEDFASIYPDGKILSFNTDQLNRFQNELTIVSKGYSGDKTSSDFERYAIANCSIAYESVQIWSDDTIFVADQIEKLNNGEIKSIFENKIDVTNMGVFGHSFGGATAGQTCLKDSRFKAFINMDGTAFGDSMNQIIEQPFMVMNG